jgi:hypothetical protein
VLRDQRRLVVSIGAVVSHVIVIAVSHITVSHVTTAGTGRRGRGYNHLHHRRCRTRV